MSSIIDSVITIERLTSHNYPTWKLRMRAVLISRELWEVTDRKTISSLPMLSDADKVKSDKALALITLCVDEEQMMHIEECNTSHEAWEKLKSIYSEPSAANRIRLYEQLFTLRLDDASDTRSHVQTLARTRTELRAIGVTVDDTLYKIALLRSLSSKFEALTIALEAQLDNLSIDELHARVYREDARQGQHSAPSNHSFYSAQNGNNKRKRIVCSFCKGEGHHITKCPRTDCRISREFRKQTDEINEETHIAHISF